VHRHPLPACGFGPVPVGFPVGRENLGTSGDGAGPRPWVIFASSVCHGEMPSWWSDLVGGPVAVESWLAHRGHGSAVRGLTTLIVAGSAAALLLRGSAGIDRGTDVAISLGLLFVARGAALGRSLYARNARLAGVILLISIGALWLHQERLCWVLWGLSGYALARPAPPPPAAGAAERRSVRALISVTPDDPLAPFAQRTDKSYAFAPGGTGAVAYRVRFGTAVASGDPVGDPAAAADAVAAFLRHAAERGWRVAVLGTARPGLWCGAGSWLSRRRAVAIGRDVVLDSAAFTLAGRRYRNLRQAVQRSRNAGVGVRVCAESALGSVQREEIGRFMQETRGLSPRGFSMILDHPLDATHPGTLLALARDRRGQLVAVHRFTLSDGGRQVCLDMPWRAGQAPNGVDERLAMEVLDWARRNGGQHVSLAFAPFTDVFEAAVGDRRPDLRYRAAGAALRAFDGFIRLRPLYLYLRKFHAFAGTRYVVFAPAQTLYAVAAMLALEFGPVERSIRSGARTADRHSGTR